jgi:DNA-binding LacI/PurR family transcriptional regulator
MSDNSGCQSACGVTRWFGCTLSPPEGENRLGIRELAKHLNISIGTVSRALNGRGDVNPETRRRVLAAAAELGYSPNQSGRSLRQGSTSAIAFMLQTYSGAELYGEPFFIGLFSGVQEVLARHGLDLIVLLNTPDGDHEAQLRRVVERRLADGILIPWTRRIDPRLDYLIQRGFPFAALGRSESGGDHPWLDLDFEQAADVAIDRLAGFGHRRIGLVNNGHDLMHGHILLAGYRSALARHGIAFDESLVRTEEMTEAGGYRLAEGLLRDGPLPTALLVGSERVAVGVYRRLNEAGIRPGRDIAIIGGMIDSPASRFLSPALTCFRLSLHDLGVRLAEALLATMPDHAEAYGVGVVQALWPLELVPRESDLMKLGR